MNIDKDSKLIYYISRMNNADVYDQLIAGQYNGCLLLRDLFVLTLLIVFGSVLATTIALATLIALYFLVASLIVAILSIYGYFTNTIPAMHEFITSSGILQKEELEYDLVLTNASLLLIVAAGVVSHALGKIPLMSKPTAKLIWWIYQVWKKITKIPNSNNVRSSLAVKIAKSLIADIKDSTCTILQFTPDSKTLAEHYREKSISEPLYRAERAKFRLYVHQHRDYDIEFWEFAKFESYTEYKEMLNVLKKGK